MKDYKKQSLNFHHNRTYHELFEIFQGKNLNLVADKGDVMVTIGVENCTVIELRENNLTCVAPTNQPVSGIAGSQLPEVNVSSGPDKKG